MIPEDGINENQIFFGKDHEDRGCFKVIDSAVLRVSQNYAALASGMIRTQQALLYSTDLPLGWNNQRIKEDTASFWKVFVKIIGFLTTAVLISFGAPFWNDVMKALLGVKDLLRDKRSITP